MEKQNLNLAHSGPPTDQRHGLNYSKVRDYLRDNLKIMDRLRGCAFNDIKDLLLAIQIQIQIYTHLRSYILRFKPDQF